MTLLSSDFCAGSGRGGMDCVWAFFRGVSVGMGWKRERGSVGGFSAMRACCAAMSVDMFIITRRRSAIAMQFVDYSVSLTGGIVKT